MNSIPVKLYFTIEDEVYDVKRFSIPKEIPARTFRKVCEKCFPEFFEQDCKFEYVDDEGEWISLGTQMEWEDALVYHHKPLLRVKISQAEKKIAKREFLKKTPKEKFVLACMRCNKPAEKRKEKQTKHGGTRLEKLWEFLGYQGPSKKVSRGTQTQKFEFLKKTPRDKFTLSCMRANKTVKKEKPKKKEVRGFQLKDFCEFINWPTKNADLKVIEKESKQEKVEAVDPVSDEKKMYAIALAVLEQMGFKDEKKNLMLLKKFNGNLQRVVHEFLGIF